MLSSSSTLSPSIIWLRNSDPIVIDLVSPIINQPAGPVDPLFVTPVRIMPAVSAPVREALIETAPFVLDDTPVASSARIKHPPLSFIRDVSFKWSHLQELKKQQRMGIPNWANPAELVFSFKDSDGDFVLVSPFGQTPVYEELCFPPTSEQYALIASAFSIEQFAASLMVRTTFDHLLSALAFTGTDERLSLLTTYAWLRKIVPEYNDGDEDRKQTLARLRIALPAEECLPTPRRVRRFQRRLAARAADCAVDERTPGRKRELRPIRLFEAEEDVGPSSNRKKMDELT